jgi:multimeric flavodoxin WrbA
MKITVFNGSPRMENGNTHILVNAFADGARKTGATVENIFLTRKSIHPCTGCYSCWFKTPGKCIFNDDMTGLIQSFLDSDLVVFASPVYVDNVTGILKNFVDRLIPMGDPHWEKDENGECRHIRTYEKPEYMGIISNCGFPEQSHFQVLRVWIKRIARNFHCSVAAEIYRGGGALLSISDPTLQPFVDSYLNTVQQAGSDVVKHKSLSKETKAQLERLLVPSDSFIDVFMQRANKRCDELLKDI